MAKMTRSHAGYQSSHRIAAPIKPHKQGTSYTKPGPQPRNPVNHTKQLNGASPVGTFAQPAAKSHETVRTTTKTPAFQRARWHT